MSIVPVKKISGKGQIYKSGEFLCNVNFSYRQIGNPKEGPIRIGGKLLVEKSKRMSPEIFNGLPGVPLELLTDSGDTMDIFASKFIGSQVDGRYSFVPMVGGNFPVKEL